MSNSIRPICIAASCAAAISCAYPRWPDPTMPVTVVHVLPDRPWTDTSIQVRRGDQIFFSATGEIYWEKRMVAAGPDGIKGSLGRPVRSGGLVGRVSDTAKPFEIGARTGFFVNPRRAHGPFHTYPPEPIKMSKDGQLWLGLKDFAPGNNKGDFEVTVRFVRP